MATPTGTVKLQNNGTDIAGATATLDATGNYAISFAGLPVGSNNVTAVYSGDTNFNPSTSPVDVQVVNAALANSATSIASTPNPSASGQAVNFTGAVTAA